MEKEAQKPVSSPFHHRGLHRRLGKKPTGMKMSAFAIAI